jgi:hypothetical protein
MARFSGDRRLVLSAILTLTIPACSQPLDTNLSVGPSGDLEVTAVTTGADLDPDGYVVAVDDSQSQPIGVNATVAYSDLAAGDHTVELSGIAGNCMVSGEKRRSVSVIADSTATTTFQVTCAGQTEAEALWGTVELTFTGPPGLSNPFRDASGAVTFTGPTSRQYTVQMFHDGDGGGGQTGTVWKARFMPGETGTWNWTSTGTHPEFEASGSFPVTDQGLDAPFEIDPSYPYWFRRKTGEHEYPVGNWLYNTSLSSSEEIALNYLATQFSDAERAETRSYHQARNLNFLGIYVHNEGDQGGTVNPYLSGPDYRRYHLGRWHNWEALMDGLGDIGISLEIWLHSDSDYDPSDQEFKWFMEYAYARLAARRGVFGFVVALEANEYWSGSKRQEFGDHLQSINVLNKPVAMHFTPGDNPDRGLGYQDYLPLQSTTFTDHAELNRLIEDNRDQNKPVYNSEFIWEGAPDGDDAARKLLWTGFVSGAASAGDTPDNQSPPPATLYAKHFADYVNGDAAPDNRPEWWKMTPTDWLVTSGTAYLLRDPDVRYLAYLPNGGSATINLSEGNGTFSYDWYNPRDGTITAGGTVSGGQSRNFSAPNSDDWLLDIRK